MQASTTDVDRLRAMSGRIAALRRAADWLQLSAALGPAIELAERTALLPSPHSDLELLQTEAMWRTEVDPEQSFERSLAWALDEAASAAHKGTRRHNR